MSAILKEKNGILNTENLEFIAEKIEGILPHGSGIDQSWTYEILKNGKIKFFNSFHVLSEFGYYVYWVDFNFKIKVISSVEIEIQNFVYDRNIIKSNSYMIDDMIEETIYYALTEKFKVI